ncbi:trypsin-like peptidase domain-containing protein [Aestuariicella hydrocarbonica]|uniref:Trypsin-like peptidase domain-containing protein n=2 Tax=Pseudomaricurvus hydrocarbonicus TaxID=1470433 RepID=A0A9E5MK05_9GAMM|nr:serine protease [Aestuariicella hydrocarbonica]NHO64717.1 trypsin-like peptidase domain-containing protein [Aestuariicella hydrocarbonica]
MGGWSSAQAGSLPETLDKVRGSVIAVGTVTPARSLKRKGPPVKILATGFVVGNGRQVITNMHVLPETIDTDNGEVLVVFSGRGQAAKATSAKVRATDAEHDLALLELTGATLQPLVLASDDFVKEGSQVAFTGFPIGMVLGLYPVTSSAIISAVTPFILPTYSASNLSAEHIKSLKNPFEVYQLDAIAYPGNSGSPVYGIDDGRVIGVVNSVFVKGAKEGLLKTPSGITYAIPVRYVKKLMRENP